MQEVLGVCSACVETPQWTLLLCSVVTLLPLWLPRNGLALSCLKLWLCPIVPSKIKCAKRSLTFLSLMENTWSTLHNVVEAKESSGIVETWVIPVSGIASIAWKWLQFVWSNQSQRQSRMLGLVQLSCDYIQGWRCHSCSGPLFHVFPSSLKHDSTMG